MDPEDLREVISAYQKCITESVRRLGGFVAKHGDGVRVCIDFKENFAVAPLDAPSAWGEELYVAGRAVLRQGRRVAQ